MTVESGIAALNSLNLLLSSSNLLDELFLSSSSCSIKLQNSSYINPYAYVFSPRL